MLIPKSTILKQMICTILWLNLPPAVFAAHPPASDIGTGNIEHVLGGISLTKDTIASAMMRIDSPDKFV